MIGPEQGETSGWFVPLRTMPWETCETCDATHVDERGLFRLEDDRNGATVCHECASQFGRIRTWEGTGCQ